MTEGLIVIGVLVAASLIVGIVVQRSLRSTGGCSCGCKVGQKSHDHNHDHSEKCCEK